MTAYVITYRLVKGSRLTKDEFDGSLHNLDDRVTELETNPPQAISIDSFEVDGDQFYVHLTDPSSSSGGAVLGPYPLPAIEWNFLKLGWQPLTILLKNDVFQRDGKLYRVQIAHTSAAIFDEGANDGDGHDLYFELLEAIASTPRVRDDDSTAITLSADISNTYNRCTSATRTLIIVPDDDTEAMPVGFEASFRQCVVDAPLTIVGAGSSAGDVQVNCPDGYMLATDRRGAVVTIKKVAANEWDVFGLLALEPVSA